VNNAKSDGWKRAPVSSPKKNRLNKRRSRPQGSRCSNRVPSGNSNYNSEGSKKACCAGNSNSNVNSSSN
jgi:hypothetical protein